MTNTQVRNATTHDLPDLKSLYWQLDSDAIFYQPEHFIRAERTDDFLKSIIQGAKSDFLLLEVDHKIIGFALVQEKEAGKISCLKQEKYVYVLDFVISEGFRSQGYGSILFKALKEWGRDRGAEFLRLSVFPENYRGIKFYEEQGLKTTMKTMECSL